MKHSKGLGAALFIVFLIAATNSSGNEAARLDADGVQRVEMVAESYSFSPDHVILKVNVPVELEVRRTTWLVPHNIVAKAPEAGLDFSVPLKLKPRTIRFTPTRTGIYPFYCDKRFLFLKSHRKRGMEGVFEVVK